MYWKHWIVYVAVVGWRQGAPSGTGAPIAVGGSAGGRSSYSAAVVTVAGCRRVTPLAEAHATGTDGGADTITTSATIVAGGRGLLVVHQMVAWKVECGLVVHPWTEAQ